MGALSTLGALLMAMVLMFVGLPALGFTPLGDPFGLAKVEAQAADGVPSTAVAYLGTDLDPNAKQKLDAFRFLSSFPAFEQAWSDAFGQAPDTSTDVRKELIEAALESSGCSASYEQDVQPWIGSKLAVAAVPGSDGQPTPLVSVQVTDADGARAAMEKLRDCSPQEVGFSISGDYLLVTESGALAQTSADQLAQGTLADDADFQDDMAQLGDLGVVTYWATAEGMANLMQLGDQTGANQLPPSVMDELTKSQQRTAGTLRFTADSAELVGAAYGEPLVTDAPANEIGNLPSDTVFAMSLSGGRQYVDALWPVVEELARTEGADLGQTSNEFQQAFGMPLQEGLATFLGDNVTVALGGGDISAAVQNDDISAIDLALDISGDHDQIQGLLDSFEQQSGESLGVTTETDDGLVTGTNQEYVDQVAAADGGLADADEFTSVVSDPEDQHFVAYLNVNAFEQPVADLMSSEGASPSEVQNFTALKSVGMTVGVDGDYTTSSIKVAVD